MARRVVTVPMLLAQLRASAESDALVVFQRQLSRATQAGWV